MLVAVGVAAALVMVGCGNDLSDSTSTTTAAESTTTSEEDSTTTEEDSTTTSEASSNGDDLAAQFESDFGMTSDQATCFVDELGADLDESGVENVASSGGPEDLSEDEALATKDAFIDCLLLPELEGQFTGADADCVADEAAAYVDEQYPDPKEFLVFITASDTATATEFGEGMGLAIVEKCMETDTSLSE
ncbi:MAG: hypothetical protein EDR02_15695 [Actinobacteria bacterium]|nr:MAG: hypothetical protein EDR02_15695 [Actinomycetota bacterium]RIK03209.1 MAG: hypothetical protein DCC48_16995 [Acidobacteriota bacterium]